MVLKSRDDGVNDILCQKHFFRRPCIAFYSWIWGREGRVCRFGNEMAGRGFL